MQQLLVPSSASDSRPRLVHWPQTPAPLTPTSQDEFGVYLLWLQLGDLALTGLLQ